MALTGDSGNGATLTLAIFNGTSAITASLDVVAITPGEFTVPSIDSSTLGTSSQMEKLPNDLADIGESSADFKWITTGVKPTLPSASGTCTITWPLLAGQSTPASYSGTGFITGLQAPTFANGQLQVGTIKWQWDGDTGPSYTQPTLEI